MGRSSVQLVTARAKTIWEGRSHGSLCRCGSFAKLFQFQVCLETSANLTVNDDCLHGFAPICHICGLARWILIAKVHAPLKTLKIQYIKLLHALNIHWIFSCDHPWLFTVFSPSIYGNKKWQQFTIHSIVQKNISTILSLRGRHSAFWWYTKICSVFVPSLRFNSTCETVLSVGHPSVVYACSEILETWIYQEQSALSRYLCFRKDMWR